MRSTLFAACLLLAIPAMAQSTTGEVTPFIGYQTGGSVIIADRHSTIDSAPVFVVMVTWDRGPGRKLDLVFAHQSTNTLWEDPWAPPPNSVKFKTYVDYAQIGGRYVFSPEDVVQPYIAMTAGGTWVSLNDAGGVGFSFAYGGGTDIRLSRRTSIRLDGRFTSTMSVYGGAYSCNSSGSCRGFTTGTLLTQFTASTGLVVRY